MSGNLALVAEAPGTHGASVGRAQSHYPSFPAQHVHRPQSPPGRKPPSSSDVTGVDFEHATCKSQGQCRTPHSWRSASTQLVRTRGRVCVPGDGAGGMVVAAATVGRRDTSPRMRLSLMELLSRHRLPLPEWIRVWRSAFNALASTFGLKDGEFKERAGNQEIRK